MVTIPEVVEEIVKKSPFLEEGLSRGLINYSAFAREVKPQIEKGLYKSVKEGAIVMALKRISEGLSQKFTGIESINLADLTVRSNLCEITFQNSDTIPAKTRQLFGTITDQKDVICTLSEGVRETTFIISSELKEQVMKIFKTELLIAEINSLSSITIRLPKEVVYIPGVYYRILKMLAWENINVVEVLSTYTELTILVETKYVDKSFSILRGFSKNS